MLQNCNINNLNRCTTFPSCSKERLVMHRKLSKWQHSITSRATCSTHHTRHNMLLSALSKCKVMFLFLSSRCIATKLYTILCNIHELIQNSSMSTQKRERFEANEIVNVYFDMKVVWELWSSNISWGDSNIEKPIKCLFNMSKLHSELNSTLCMWKLCHDNRIMLLCLRK